MILIGKKWRKWHFSVDVLVESGSLPKPIQGVEIQRNPVETMVQYQISPYSHNVVCKHVSLARLICLLNSSKKRTCITIRKYCKVLLFQYVLASQCGLSAVYPRVSVCYCISSTAVDLHPQLVLLRPWSTLHRGGYPQLARQEPNHFSARGHHPAKNRGPLQGSEHLYSPGFENSEGTLGEARWRGCLLVMDPHPALFLLLLHLHSLSGRDFMPQIGRAHV